MLALRKGLGIFGRLECYRATLPVSTERGRQGFDLSAPSGHHYAFEASRHGSGCARLEWVDDKVSQQPKARRRIGCLIPPVHTRPRPLP